MSEVALSVRDLEVEFATRKGPLRALDRVSFVKPAGGAAEPDDRVFVLLGSKA